MIRIFLAIASIFGAISVAAGAFASHALKEQLSERSLAIFETGARYQMYHALALLLVALLLTRADLPAPPTLAAAGIAFIAGVVIFSGSLYALSLSGIKWLGAITPFGGVALIVGWGCLAIAAFSSSLEVVIMFLRTGLLSSAAWEVHASAGVPPTALCITPTGTLLAIRRSRAKK